MNQVSYSLGSELVLSLPPTSMGQSKSPGLLFSQRQGRGVRGSQQSRVSDPPNSLLLHGHYLPQITIIFSKNINRFPCFQSPLQQPILCTVTSTIMTPATGNSDGLPLLVDSHPISFPQLMKPSMIACLHLQLDIVLFTPSLAMVQRSSLLIVLQSAKFTGVWCTLPFLSLPPGWLPHLSCSISRRVFDSNFLSL